MTASNPGTADSPGVVVTDFTPANTTWQSGGTFSVDHVSSSLGTITPGSTATLTYTVLVNSSLPYSYSSPFGVTTLSTSGSATSTNTASPAGVTTTLSTGASPAYTITDSPSGAVGFPLTTVANSVTNSSFITVASSSLLTLGGYLALFNGTSHTIAQVTAISGTSVTLNTPVSVSSGTNVIPAVQYTLSYANNGRAPGTNVVGSGVLASGLFFGRISLRAAPPPPPP